MAERRGKRLAERAVAARSESGDDIDRCSEQAGLAGGLPRVSPESLHQRVESSAHPIFIAERGELPKNLGELEVVVVPRTQGAELVPLCIGQRVAAQGGEGSEKGSVCL